MDNNYSLRYNLTHMKKLTIEQKVKLFYSGELIVIAIVVIVIGILKLVGVIETKPVRLLIYNIITTLGAIWFIFDIIWALRSEKRRKKVSLLDKALTIPASLYLLFFDIYCYIYKIQNLEPNDTFVKISVGIILLYIGVIYIFQGIYHYSHPIPSLIEAIEEAQKAEEEERQKEKIEENQNEEKDNSDTNDENNKTE